MLIDITNIKLYDIFIDTSIAYEIYSLSGVH